MVEPGKQRSLRRWLPKPRKIAAPLSVSLVWGVTILLALAAQWADAKQENQVASGISRPSCLHIDATNHEPKVDENFFVLARVVCPAGKKLPAVDDKIDTPEDYLEPTVSLTGPHDEPILVDPIGFIEATLTADTNVVEVTAVTDATQDVLAEGKNHWSWRVKFKRPTSTVASLKVASYDESGKKLASEEEVVYLNINAGDTLNEWLKRQIRRTEEFFSGLNGIVAPIATILGLIGFEEWRKRRSGKDRAQHSGGKHRSAETE